jgi:hypothetical protein
MVPMGTRARRREACIPFRRRRGLSLCSACRYHRHRPMICDGIRWRPISAICPGGRPITARHKLMRTILMRGYVTGGWHARLLGPRTRVLTRTDVTIGAASLGVIRAIGLVKSRKTIGLCIGTHRCKVHLAGLRLGHTWNVLVEKNRFCRMSGDNHQRVTVK